MDFQFSGVVGETDCARFVRVDAAPIMWADVSREAFEDALGIGLSLEQLSAVGLENDKPVSALATLKFEAEEFVQGNPRRVVIRSVDLKRYGVALAARSLSLPFDWVDPLTGKPG